MGIEKGKPVKIDVRIASERANERIEVSIDSFKFCGSSITPSNLNNLTVVLVNDASLMNFGGTTLTLGTNTTIEGFGNNITQITVPNSGTQPLNVVGSFALGGATFTDTRGGATLTANANVLTLGNGDTVQNINISGGTNQIIGSGTAGFTLSGVAQTAAGVSAISLTNSTGTIQMTGGSISGALGDAFVVVGGSAAITYTGNI
jgi:hypothetical protein